MTPLLLLLYQATWFACVLGAAAGHPWLGVGAAAAALAAYFGGRGRPRPVLAAGVLGTSGDLALAQADLVAYRGGLVWIAALWLAFGTLLDTPLRWLHGRPLVAAGLAAPAGVFAYVGAERLGAIELHADGLAAVGLLYAVAVPALLRLGAHR